MTSANKNKIPRFSKQQVAYRRPSTTGHQRLVACTNCFRVDSEAEVEAVQSGRFVSVQQVAVIHTAQYVPVHSLCSNKSQHLPFDLDENAKWLGTCNEHLKGLKLAFCQFAF